MRFFRLHSTVLAFSLMALAGFLAYLNVPAAFSQVTTAAIHGIVTDPTGAVIPNAKITALDTATGISTSTTTNKGGIYTFPSLQIGGPYTVIVEVAGFATFQKTRIMLTVNADLEENASLKVGSAQQTVMVDASTIQVETINTQLEQNLPASQIENLPMLGRDAASMERLAPGVVESSDRFGSYSVNGSQTTSNSFQLDGIDNNDGPLQDEGLQVNPDALAEQNTVESTINPEFSRNGGAVVNQVIKNGTNSLHGSGFEYYRDTFMNLGGYFAPPGVRVPFHQNLYGGTLGGPVIKNRIFGFAAYQGYRNRTGAIMQTPVFQSGILPSGTSTGGIFTNEYNLANGGTNGTVGLTENYIPFDITTGSGTTCGPGTQNLVWNTIPATSTTSAVPGCFPTGSPVVINPISFSPLAKKIAEKYVPAGNAGSVTAPLYSFATANTAAQDQGVLKADYHISDKDAISGTGIFQSSPNAATLPFGWQFSPPEGADLPGFGMVNARHYKLFAAQETHTFSSKTLNVLRAGYMRFKYGDVEPATPVDPSILGFNITPQSPSSGVPTMILDGLFTLGFTNYGPQPRKDTNLTYSDNFSHIFGNHDLKIGGTVEQFRVSNAYYAENNGSYSYAGAGEYSSGDPGIDFLLGIPDGYTQSSGGYIDAIAWEYYIFAQDSWRATSDLTINYGLAWDVEAPNLNTQFNGLGITCFQLSTQTSTVFPGGFPGLTWPGDPGCTKAGGATTHYAHFGPRLGFAWSPSNGPAALIGGSGAHKFSVRGGFGVYFNRDQEEGNLQNLGDLPNFYESRGAADFLGSPGFANPFVDVTGCTGCSETNPFPYVRPKPGAALDWANYTEQDISEFDRNYTVPYIYNFNLNIQRQLPGNMVMQIGYVGSLGRKLATFYEGDPITAAGHAACLADVGAEAGCSTTAVGISEQHLYYPQNAAQPATTGGIPDFLSVGTLNTEGASNYNSLQASLVKNTSHGLYFTLAYTYSHGLDNASGLESSGFFARGMNWVPGYQHLNYGDSDYDARQRLVASYDYKIPLLASMNQNFAVKEILGDWHVAGLTVLQTGFPVLITDAGVFNSLWCDEFEYYDCPDDVNTSSFSIQKYNPRVLNANGLNQYFNTSTFSQEAIGTFGNVGRNFFHGPGFNYTDLSVYKILPLGHDTARSLQIMLQAANVFNHANFDPPDGNFTDGPYFGTVSSVREENGVGGLDYNGDPAPGRTAQIVAKINF